MIGSFDCEDFTRNILSLLYSAIPTVNTALEVIDLLESKLLHLFTCGKTSASGAAID
jgi:hypothetical protein